MSKEQTSERGCGPCNACCQHLTIDDPQLQKPAGVLCNNWRGGGCTIYEKRPAACSAFLCGWRQMTLLGEEWRPDRSRILMVTEKSDIPPGYGEAALKFILLEMKALLWPPLVERIAHLVEQRLPCFIQINDHANRRSQKLFLSDALRPAVATRHYQTICNALVEAAEIGVQDLRRQALAHQPAASAYAPFSRR